MGIISLDTRQRVKILLVDDTSDNLVSLEAALESLGEELIFARSGKEALRHLLEGNFAAILLDVKMPDMDGFETAELIRSRPRSRHIPILFLTGYKNEEHLFRGYDLGAVDFLFKPIVPEVLRSKVAVFVELSRKAELLEEQTKALRSQAAVLEKAEQQFRSLLEAAPDAMVICRKDGEINLVNSRTESLFGYPRSELMGRHITSLVPEWAFESSLDGEDEPGNLLRTISFELDALRRDAREFPVEITMSPLLVEGSLLVTTAIRDITGRREAERERRRAEQEVRELNAHLEVLNSSLEERVIARTEELTRSNDELAQFAYIASHDLQEPLRTIALYTQLLARRYEAQLQGDGALFMQHIVENAQRMERLISDILEFSRLDARVGDRLQPVRCDECVDDAIASLEIRIRETGATIARPESLQVVHGDPSQLTRLFLNLLGNAIKYSRPTVPPRIDISAVPCGTDWLYTIADNGIGIEPQYAERIFGIFKRLHGRDTPGTGMGLAICKKIVARHGGRIWLDATEGPGARFCFTLPRAEAGPV